MLNFFSFFYNYKSEFVLGSTRYRLVVGHFNTFKTKKQWLFLAMISIFSGCVWFAAFATVMCTLLLLASFSAEQAVNQFQLVNQFDVVYYHYFGCCCRFLSCFSVLFLCVILINSIHFLSLLFEQLSRCMQMHNGVFCRFKYRLFCSVVCV